MGPIRRLAAEDLGLKSANAACTGMDEVLHAVDTHQRSMYNGEGTDPFAVPYTQLGAQYATPEDFPKFQVSKEALEAIPLLEGDLAVYDQEDITQITPAQADKAEKVARKTVLFRTKDLGTARVLSLA